MKNHELRNGDQQRHDQRGDRQCNAATPVLLKLRSAESHDRPCEHGQRAGTCALHDPFCERVPSVADVRGTKRHGDERGDERTDRERDQGASPACEAFAQQRVHCEQIRSRGHARDGVGLVERRGRQPSLVNEVPA